MRTNTPYNQKEKDFVKKHRKLHRKDLTRRFNRQFNRDLSVQLITGLCKRNGWTNGLSTRFKKGSIPYNKGKTGGKPSSPATCFKKGHIPANTKPVFSERICKKEGYLLIKAKGGRHEYKLKHRYLWKKHKGKIPKGMIIRFKDGDKTNITMKNLEMVTHNEHLMLNQMDYNHSHESLKHTIRLMAKLYAGRREMIQQEPTT